MQKFKLLFFFIVFAQATFAQQFEQELKEAIRQKPRLELRFDSRNSFISQSGVRVFGFKLGLQYQEKLSIGLGYNQLWSSLVNHNLLWEGKSISGELKFNYWSPYVEYTFYQDQYWEMSIPVQLGIGAAYYENRTDIGPGDLYKKTVFSYEPAITFQYRFMKYFAAGMGVGYRLMIVPNREIKERFTAPVYLFKFKIYFQDLLRDFSND